MARKDEGWTLHRDERTGVYTVRFRIEGRRYHRSTRTRDRAEAQERARAIWRDAVTGGTRSAGSLAGLDVVTLCASWLSAMESEARPPTLATWELYVRSHFVPHFKDAAALTSDRQLAAYVAKRLRKVKGATVAKECSALQSLLNWCARPDVGYLAAAPKVPRPAPSSGVTALEKIRVDLPAETAEAIIAHLPETIRAHNGSGPRPCRALFRALWETGLRIGTLYRLEAPRDYRRGSAELVIREEADKSGAARVLDLTPAARAALDSVCPDAGALFQPIDYRTQLERAALKAGVPGHLAGHVSHHDFRHGRITSLLDSGAALTGVAYLAGHKQITTTNGYVHARRSEGRKALEAGHRPGHGAGPEAGGSAKSAMGHGGLEPPANGLRVHLERRLRLVSQGDPTSGEAPGSHESPASGHGVPAIGAALLAALEARRAGNEWGAWDHVETAAELVAAALETLIATSDTRRAGG